MTKKPDSVDTSVLLVSPDEPDHLALRGIVRRPEWILLRARNPIEAQLVLGHRSVDVVIADSQCWKALLAQMWTLDFPLIVADRLADERLWAEVLNLGAFDLLSKPFDAEIVLHVLSSACRYETADVEIMFGKLHGGSEGQPAEEQYLESAALVHP